MRSRSRRAGGGKVAAITLALLAAALAASCAREPEAKREIRLAGERYLAALARKDFGEIRRRATCLVQVQSVQGGNVLRIDTPRHVTVATLDSLAFRSTKDSRVADSLWIQAPEVDRDALFQKAQRARWLDITYRNALRAVQSSRPDSLLGARSEVETCSLRARVRFAGELIGPKPVDREMILRMLRAPRGAWIVFSLFNVEDDPKPDGV